MDEAKKQRVLTLFAALPAAPKPQQPPAIIQTGNHNIAISGDLVITIDQLGEHHLKALHALVTPRP